MGIRLVVLALLQNGPNLNTSSSVLLAITNQSELTDSSSSGAGGKFLHHRCDGMGLIG